MKPRSHIELLDAFKVEINGEWLTVYDDKPFIEMIIRKCFFYYDTRSEAPDSREAWKRAISSFLKGDFKDRGKPAAALKSREPWSPKPVKYPEATDIISSQGTDVRDGLTPEQLKEKMRWILTMMADKGNLGIRHDQIEARLARMPNEAAIVKAIVGAVEGNLSDECPF